MFLKLPLEEGPSWGLRIDSISLSDHLCMWVCCYSREAPGNGFRPLDSVTPGRGHSCGPGGALREQLAGPHSAGLGDGAGSWGKDVTGCDFAPQADVRTTQINLAPFLENVAMRTG